jgi:hypothetical protein
MIEGQSDINTKIEQLFCSICCNMNTLTVSYEGEVGAGF